MRERIKNFIFDNQLLSGSLVMVLSSIFVNFGNYLYQLLMARMLGPVNYGSLISLIAIFYLLSIPSLALATVVVKFTTIFKAKNDYRKLYSLFRSFSEKIFVLGIPVLLFFLLGRSPIANFLNTAEVMAVMLIGFFPLLSLLATINNGILQGLLNFNFLATNNIFGTLLKTGLGVFLVWMGFSVNGAILAILASYILPYAISLYPLRFLLRHKPKTITIDQKEILIYAGPATLAIFGMTSLYSTDIILVKHFFPAFEAGLYGALSVVGKIIFFASSTIVFVMFPLISEKFEKGEKYHPVLYEALALVVAASLFLTFIYFLWPKLMLRLLYGSLYLEVAPYLGLFAVFISVYSLSSLMIQFFLSVRQTKVAFFSFGAAALQVVLIWFFHQNFFQVIYSSIAATSLLLAFLLVYYFRSAKVAPSLRGK